MGKNMGFRCGKLEHYTNKCKDKQIDKKIKRNYTKLESQPEVEKDLMSYQVP